MWEREVRAEEPRAVPEEAAPERRVAPKAPPKTVVVQARLRVGAVDDPAEREADRVADTFAGAGGGARPARRVRRRADDGSIGAAGGPVSPGVETQVAGLRGGGQALADPVRGPLEHFFGRDLSELRIHASGAADRLNRELDAVAFTSGSDIFFSAGAYRPNDSAGRHLLAHEVTHVIQQSGRIARSTCHIQRAPTPKGDGGGTYTDDKIPGATLVTTGAADSSGGVGYRVVESGEEFMYNTNSGKYFVGMSEVDPATLVPSAKDAVMAATTSTPIVSSPLITSPTADPTSELRKLYEDAKTKSKGHLKMSFEKWAAARQSKTSGKKDLTKPINVGSDAELKSLWGGRARFDKWERATAITKMFTNLGYTVGEAKESTTSSAKENPPVLFAIQGHPMISLFEVHPGGGIHGAPYIRLSANSGMIKVRNDSLSEKYDPLTEKKVKYVDVAIAE